MSRVNSGAPGCEFSYKAILHLQVKVRVRLLVVQVPVLLAEVTVLVVAHLDETVLHPEGIAVVLADRVAVNLRNPTIEVSPVEEIRPLGGGGAGSSDDDDAASFSERLVQASRAKRQKSETVNRMIEEFVCGNILRKCVENQSGGQLNASR